MSSQHVDETAEVVGFLNPQPLPPFPNPEARVALRIGPGPGDPYRLLANVGQVLRFGWGEYGFARRYLGVGAEVSIVER